MLFYPTASKETWTNRNRLIKKTRSFFEDRNVLEVETPLLSNFCGTDPHLDYFETTPPARYLMTSPEFHMKRLLASGFGDIFQITKAFRKDESGNRHNLEFSILEWYRTGFLMEDIMVEVEDFCALILNRPVRAKRTRWEDAFKEYTQTDPLIDDYAYWISGCKRLGIPIPGESERFCLSDWWDYWMVMLIEPMLGKEGPEFIWYYPPSQAALAQITEDFSGKRWACRFELYIDHVELCNGYQELTDAGEQEIRFQEDILLREKMGKSKPRIDSLFLEALRLGMPPCSGVALGLDRLFMLALSKEKIEEVLLFPERIA